MAEVEHAKSQANLGLLYLCGKGVEKDVDRAVQWMERAATQGIVSAQFTLGFLYSTTKHGQLDPSRSIHWYLAAARQGHPQASLNLARAYEKGVGVKASSVEALRWLIAASKIDKSEKLQGKFVEFEQELRAKLSEESIAKAVELAECCSRGETVASGSAANVQAGKALAEDLNCGGCHGEEGITDHDKIPNLAGQQPRYLRAQLGLFRAVSGTSSDASNRLSTRRDRLMSDIAVNLSDQNIADIADYYAGFSCGVPATSDGIEMPATAEHCASCHGNDGRSECDDFPHLAGQKEGYLRRQLTLLRNSADIDPAVDFDVDLRHHGKMAPNVESLSSDEIASLDQYYSGLSWQ